MFVLFKKFVFNQGPMEDHLHVHVYMYRWMGNPVWISDLYKIFTVKDSWIVYNFVGWGFDTKSYLIIS